MELINENCISNLQIVACDHGNRMIKGEYGFKYDSGYIESLVAPITTNNLIQYNERYYTFGQNRFEIMDNKGLDEKFFILTLPVIGNSLKVRGLKSGEICIAAGLPIVSFSRLKDSFRRYLIREDVRFKYNDEEFKVSIKEAFIFPQNIAGAMARYQDLKNLTNVIIVDLGGGTLDYTILDKGVPNINKTGSQNIGIIHLFNAIKQEILSSKGIMADDAQIEDIILKRNNPLFMNEGIEKIVIQKTEAFVNSLLWKLREENFETRANPVIFMGGGAQLLKDYFVNNENLSYYEILNEFVNVDGFKILAKQKLVNYK